MEANKDSIGAASSPSEKLVSIEPAASRERYRLTCGGNTTCADIVLAREPSVFLRVVYTVRALLSSCVLEWR